MVMMMPKERNAGDIASLRLNGEERETFEDSLFHLDASLRQFRFDAPEKILSHSFQLTEDDRIGDEQDDQRNQIDEDEQNHVVG